MYIYRYYAYGAWGWYVGWDTDGHYSAFYKTESMTPPEAGWRNRYGDAPRMRVQFY